MKKVLTLVMVLGLAAMTLTAGSDKKDIPFVLSGTVTESATQEALTGVKVTVLETGDVVYTDFDGKFSYNAARNGNYHLSFSYVSFDDKSVEFNAESNNINVKLK